MRSNADPARVPWARPVTLTGRRVRLEPLDLRHLDDLAAVGLDPAIWTWTIARPGDREGLRAWLEAALANAAAGVEVPFATIDLASGRAIGSSRFLNIVPEHRRLEIGWTWLGRGVPADSGANREAKLLQLAHAFDDLGRQPRGVQDGLAERAVARGPPRHRRHVRGDLPEPHDHAGRAAPALRVLQRRRRGVAGGPGAPRSAARPAVRRASAGPRPVIRTVDYHTGGEPFRIVVDGAPPLEGRTVLERRRWARDHADHVRRLLVDEPRGHADMYGCFVTPPDDAGADLGVVFFHNEGYSTACGHGTIALVTWAIDEGRVRPTGPEARVVVDVPSGRLECRARLDDDGRVESVAFRNVPSWVLARDLEVPTTRGARSRRRRVRRRLLRVPGRTIDRPRCLAGQPARPHRAPARAPPGARCAARSAPPGRARPRRDLRRHLLAGGAGRSGRRPRPAQRHGLRRRRGRPLAVRERNVGPPRAPRRARRRAARAGADPSPSVDRRLRSSPAGSSGPGRRSAAGRRSSPRWRARPSAPAAMPSSWTPATRSGPGSSSARCAIVERRLARSRSGRGLARADRGPLRSAARSGCRPPNPGGEVRMSR